MKVASVVFISVVAVGGAFYVIHRGQPAVIGGPSQTPVASSSSSHSEPAPTAAPVPTPAGPMHAARQIHTATLLADGRVLVAGGYDANDAALASAELYDPKTGTFSATGSLATARGLHTATLLADGRVLIAGGGPAGWSVAGPYLASAELYDPKTGTFSPTGSMATAREGHTATLLADGRVLIAGGTDTNGHGVASAELYDPKTGTFSATGPMTTARGFHTATLLSDGRVLIAGGDPTAWTESSPFLASAELYDPKTGTFTATGPMTVVRAHHAATLLSDGRVLVTGGIVSVAGAPISDEIYDPKTGTFSLTGAMAAERIYHTATLLADGRVLIAGGEPPGQSGYGPFLASAELYDPNTGTFSPTGSLASARAYQTATLLADGRVLVTAGEGSLGAVAPLASAEIYDPKTDNFSRAGQGG